MATYTELFDLGQEDSELRNRVAVACSVAAEAVRSEDPETENHTERLAWAAQVFAYLLEEAQRMLWAVLAANKDLTIEQIHNATDEAIQTAVDTVVDLFAVAGGD